MNEFKSMPITLITGYLGSGKTTLLNNLLNNSQGYKIAVIVNDIGEVNIDADLIEEGGVVNSQDESLVPLQNGCICCTLKQDLIEQICTLVEKQKFDHIVIEASGICEPMPIAQTIVAIGEMCKANRMPEICHLDAIVSVVDAKRLADEFNCGEDLTKQNLGEEDIENLVFQQLEFCDLIILNKISEVDYESLQRVKTVIKHLQPVAKIIETDYAKVDISRVLDVNLFDFEKSAGSAGWIQEMEKDHDQDDLDDDCECDHECHCHDDEDECHCHCHDEHEHNEHNCDCEGECHCHDHKDDECHCHKNEQDNHEHHHHGHHHCHHHHNGETEEYGISTYVYARREPFDRIKFAEFCAKDWGRKIIRTKGLVYFKNDTDMCYLFESAGKQKTLAENGKWWATMPKAELEQLQKAEPQLFKKWDETYGDREVKLVFIGQHLNKKELKETLDKI